MANKNGFEAWKIYENLCKRIVQLRLPDLKRPRMLLDCDSLKFRKVWRLVHTTEVVMQGLQIKYFQILDLGHVFAYEARR